MLQVHVFALIYVIGVSSLFAVTESGSGAPESGCEAELVQDPFIKVVARLADLPNASTAALEELANADQPTNPFKRLTKTPDNLALLQALDRELAKMNSARWAKLRPHVAGLAAARKSSKDQRQDSREYTAPVLALDKIYETGLSGLTMTGLKWRQDGEKVRVYVSSSEESKVLLRTNDIDIGSVKFLSEGEGVRGVTDSDSDLIFSHVYMAAFDLKTLTTAKELRWFDIGLLQMSEVGQFVIRKNKNGIGLRPIDRSPWSFWQWKIRFPFPYSESKYVKAIGGKNDGYVLFSRASGESTHIHQFDGKRVQKLNDLVWGNGAKLTTDPQWIRGRDGNLFVLGRFNQRLGTAQATTQVYEIRGTQVLEPLTLGTDAESASFHRDLDGRVAVMTMSSHWGWVTLQFLEGAKETFTAPLRGDFPKLIGAFRYRGNYAAVYHCDNSHIRILDFQTREIVAELPLRVTELGRSRSSLYQAPNLKTYLAVEGQVNVLQVYNLFRTFSRTQ